MAATFFPSSTAYSSAYRSVSAFSCSNSNLLHHLRQVKDEALINDDKDNKLINETLIAGSPSFDINPSRDGLKRAKIRNKLKGNTNENEVKIIKDMLGGDIELPKI